MLRVLEIAEVFCLFLVIMLTIACSNASYEIIKPKGKNSPPPTGTPTPEPTFLPTPTYPPLPTTSPEPTPTGQPTITPLPTPTYPPLPTPIPTGGPIIVPNPDPNGPFPPKIPCPGPCMLRDTEIIFVLDNSVSMADKMGYIQRNIQGFINFFRPFPNVSFSIVGDNCFCGEPFIPFPFTLVENRFRACVNSHNAISRINDALASRTVSANTHTEIIIISDDNGFGVGNRSENFQFRHVDSVNISAIIGVEKSSIATASLKLCFDTFLGCRYDAVGYEYIKLAMMTRSGVYDICNKNWTPILLDIFNRNQL